MSRALCWGLMVASASACGKPSSQGSPEPAPPASVAAGASGRAVTSATATPAISSWEGSYTSVAGGITLPKDVKWKVPESPSGLGDGKIALTVDSASGRVLGTVDGPLGPATLHGLASDGRLTATVARQDPSDHGFIGTLAGEVIDGGAHGTMNLALAEVSAVRNATFHLSPMSRVERAPGLGQPSLPAAADAR
jgi:hypothetical protein